MHPFRQSGKALLAASGTKMWLFLALAATYVAELFGQRSRREVRQGAYVMHFANSGAGLTHEAVETRLTDAWMSKVIEPLITVTQGGRIIDQEKYRGMIRRTDEDVAADRTRRGSAFVRVELAARSPPAKVRKREGLT